MVLLSSAVDVNTVTRGPPATVQSAGPTNILHSGGLNAFGNYGMAPALLVRQGCQSIAQVAVQPAHHSFDQTQSHNSGTVAIGLGKTPKVL